MSIVFRQANRLEALPPYIFSEINAIKADAQKRGIDLLSLGIGDPDRPTPPEIVAKIREAALNPPNHVYSPYEGTLAFREAVTRWFLNRFGVSLDPAREVVALIGSKEGIAHFPVAFLNPGDVGLFPSPGYPIFSTSISLAGATPVAIPLRAENGFVPDPDEVRSLIKQFKPRSLLLNFPSNPTSAVCSREVLTEIVRMATEHQVILIHDLAYSEIYFDANRRPPSLMEIPGAKEVAIEFHSLSKTFNMTGWRIAFAVGNPQLVAGLLRAKTNIDSGPLLAVQEASIYALDNSDRFCEPIRKVYAERRQCLLEGLGNLGIEYFEPLATFFVWARVPKGGSSMQFTKDLIEKVGLVVTPGIGFGEEGEGFFRLALTVDTPLISEALSRLGRFLSKP